MLFADVKGSMDMAEQQDPEQWRKIMQRFFSILADGVHRFEGTVDKFTGDGIMAVFGAPVAHEDHARRACYAALQMLDDIAEYAAELRRRRRAQLLDPDRDQLRRGGGRGDRRGQRRRLHRDRPHGRPGAADGGAGRARQGLPDRGRGGAGPRLPRARGPGRVRDQGGEPAGAGLRAGRGRRGPLAARPLARARLLPLRRPRRGDGARWRRRCRAPWPARARRSAIVAEPGIGKSRLCHEFAERCRERGIEVFEAQAQAHGREIPFMPVLQMLRAYFGIADADPERIVREKIAGRALLLDPELRRRPAGPLRLPRRARPRPPVCPSSAPRRAHGRCAGVVCRLVRAPGSPRTDRRSWSRTCTGWTRAARRCSASCSARSRARRRWRSSTSAPNTAPAGPPRPLPPDLAGAAGPGRYGASCCATWPATTRRSTASPSLIHERTAGNPFFIEEIVRELAEAGNLEGERGAYRLVRPVEDAGVPATVQTVLAARIDRLDPAAKQLLQVSLGGRQGGRRARPRPDRPGSATRAETRAAVRADRRPASSTRSSSTPSGSSPSATR